MLIVNFHAPFCICSHCGLVNWLSHLSFSYLYPLGVPACLSVALLGSDSFAVLPWAASVFQPGGRWLQGSQKGSKASTTAEPKVAAELRAFYTEPYPTESRSAYWVTVCLLFASRRESVSVVFQRPVTLGAVAGGRGVSRVWSCVLLTVRTEWLTPWLRLSGDGWKQVLGTFNC